MTGALTDETLADTGARQLQDVHPNVYDGRRERPTFEREES